jgi:aromatic ring-cleaving dioxygenase
MKPVERVDPRDHYAGTGKNAHIVFRSAERKETCELQARCGRPQDGEAVQLVAKRIKTDSLGRHREYSVYLSIGPEEWAALVEFVREGRTVTA